MENYDLFLNITYDAKNNKFELKTNVRKDAISELVTDTITTYIDTDFSSIDTADDFKIDIFKISIKVDLSNDTFYLSTNGSSDITLGILAQFLRDFGNDKVEIN